MRSGCEVRAGGRLKASTPFMIGLHVRPGAATVSVTFRCDQGPYSCCRDITKDEINVPIALSDFRDKGILPRSTGY